jgi:hypothetical protein
MSLQVYPSGLSGNVLLPSPTNLYTNNNSSAAASGSVIQTVYKRVDSLSTWSAPVNANTPVWDLDINITPKRADSSILIRYHFTYEMHHDTVFRFARGENMGKTTNPGREGGGGYSTQRTDINRWIGTWVVGYDTNTDSTPFTRTFMYLDPSESTETRTYRVYVSGSGGTAYTLFLNRPTGNAQTTNYEIGITMVMAQEII